jgi:hypothetical protein
VERPVFRALEYWPDSFNPLSYALQLLRAEHARCYLELGSYCGASALFMAQYATQARIICVDPWDGRGPGEGYPLQAASLDAFQHHLWPYRERVEAWRMTSLEGLRLAYELGVRPDLVFIDADHSYEFVRADLQLARELFPEALVCGDDYYLEGVSRAVIKTLGNQFGVIGASFWWEMKVAP